MNFQINALIPFPNSDRSINVTLYGENNTEFEAAMRTVRQYDLQIEGSPLKIELIDAVKDLRPVATPLTNSSASPAPHIEANIHGIGPDIGGGPNPHYNPIGSESDDSASLHSGAFTGELCSLETSEDCARPYDLSRTQYATHSGPTLLEEQEIRNAYYQQMLHNVASVPTALRQTVSKAYIKKGGVISIDVTNPGSRFEPDSASPKHDDYVWKLAYNAWVKAYPDAKCFDLNSPQYEIQGRVLAAALEMPEVLEASELYRMRMAAISSTSLGYLKDRQTVVESYKTPALDDVCKLYDAYTRNGDALIEARQLNAQLQAQIDGFKSASLAGKAVDDLADVYEREATAQLDRDYAEASAELGAIRALAIKHGWSYGGVVSLTDILTEWLEKFAKLGVLYETQKLNLGDLMARNAALTEANAQFEQRGNRIQELATLAQNQARTIETNEKTIVKLNRRLQKLSAAK